MGKLTILLAQLNPTVGDIEGNLSKLRAARAENPHADLIVASELFLSGYPAEDLVLKPSFQDSVRAAVNALAKETADGGPAILLGAPWREEEKLYNAALLLDGGKVAAATYKHDLPNYGPFDEKRVFSSAPLPVPVPFRRLKLGVMICEDMWTPAAAANLKKCGAHILIVPNGSPFEIGKAEIRRDLATHRAKETGLPLIYVNQIGGQDELVFDGASFAVDGDGNLLATLPSWQEKIHALELEEMRYSSGGSFFFRLFNPSRREIKSAAVTTPASQENPNDFSADVYHALMIGLRDYVNKNGFPGIVLGLSGGIDSALAAVIAADAIGPDRVRCVMLPSPFTSNSSYKDADAVASALGCKLDTLPIAGAMKTFDGALRRILGDKLQGVTSENIQARSRGLILMAISNATGAMVLSTGNKSEMSVGYATLYGDMCGGFAVLKDVYKTEVYKAARWRNAHKPATALGPDGPIISERILTKAPTAELRPDQKDQDSLPPYDILDGVLKRLIEKDQSVAEASDENHPREIVEKVWTLLTSAEYKRRQSPPGVKITPRNLSRDRRYPITNKYREKLPVA